ncbi:MAG: hypothetical protein K0S32_2409 [Bacteroidetes bacterium]|jgi:hypothetical protein|nr:hypothetical protein [Bacteroidota bacterium]
MFLSPFKGCLTTLAIAYSIISMAQTGPGGVGSTTNNKLWLDANRGVTVSSGSVTAWADQSGNAFSAVPSAVIARPNFSANQVNGYPSIDFDGTNDELWINDNAAFDLTQWHIFLVPRVAVQKDYNAWLVKGNDGAENYELLSFSTGNIHTPTFYTDATRTSPSAPAGQVTTTGFNIIEYSYVNTVGRDVYTNFGNVYTDNENKTPATNNFSVYIGNEKNIAGRFINGDLAEVIVYNAVLNPAQRIIVNNYLAAKYNLTLTASDIYDEDNAGNGNFDHEVAGIGQSAAGSNQLDSKGSGIVRVLNPVGLGDGEYYIFGHNGGAAGTYSTADIPAGVQGRMVRTWRGSETGAITSFDIRFDLTGLGAVTTTDLRLLIDTNNDGAFADETVGGGGILSGATSLGGNVYAFTGVTGLNDNIRFTIATTNVTQTPLPIELTAFNAIAKDKRVEISWSTASEKNNDYFTIERSKDAVSFETVSLVKSAGNNGSMNEYYEVDYSPSAGISYYRLKQTDKDGKVSYSQVIPVNYYFKEEGGISVFPNPTDGPININFDINSNEETLVVIRDIRGREFYSKVFLKVENNQIVAIDPDHKLDPGVYIVVASSENRIYSQKLIIK